MLVFNFCLPMLFLYYVSYLVITIFQTEFSVDVINNKISTFGITFASRLDTFLYLNIFYNIFVGKSINMLKYNQKYFI